MHSNRLVRLLPSRVAAACLLLATTLLPVAACSSTPDPDEPKMSVDPLRSTEVEPPDEQAVAVAGNIAITWMNLDPRNADVVMTLVNASSEVGQRLRSGKQASTVVRVVSDGDMGLLLSTLEKNDFFEFATPGVGINSIPEIANRRGVVVLHRDGRNWGLMLVPNRGNTGLPKAYSACKNAVMIVHGATPSPEVSVSVGESDRVFEMPPIQPPKR